MSPFVQQVVAFGAVALACAYLAWRWRRNKTAPTCDSCHAGAPRASRTGGTGKTGVRPRSLRVLDNPRN